MSKEIITIASSVSSEEETIVADQVLYRVLVDSLLEYAVFAISPSGMVMSWNAGAEQTFGYTHAEIIGQPFSIIFTAEDAAAQAPLYELSTALSGEQTQHDRWHVRKDATRFWGTNTVRPLYDAAGGLLGYTKLVRDTTVSHLALQKLSDSEQQLRLILESVPDYAIFTIALDGTITSWNAGAQKVFGYKHAEIVGFNFAVLFSDDDVICGAPLVELRKATTYGVTNVERWLARKDGTRFLASGKLSQLKRDAAGDLRGFVRIAHDITEQHAAAQDLRRRAQNDELTELPNRRTFYEHVQRAIAAMKRKPTNSFAVLFIDLDHFKHLNDRYGHVLADELLAVTARRLETCVRSVDIVARIGGDEFAILLNGISGVSDANDAAHRIESEMQQPVTIEGRDVRVTASVGIALGSLTYDRPEDILRDADAAMYTAKTDGRARAVVFAPSFATDAGAKITLAADVHRALEGNELHVAFQPVMRLRDNTAVGFEALVRWQHPKHGLLEPSQFIPVAEESHSIVVLDHWMIEQAAMQLVTWQSQGLAKGLHISVNVSSKEFSRDGFVDDLRRNLASSGLNPALLRLEITESAAVERSERTSAMLAAIRALGVKVDIDDFGTGYSSLWALQHLRVDALKIDASFVASMDSPCGSALVETIVTLAHKLGISAIAEGIETAEQRRQLVALGCDYGQGFLFAPPLDVDAAAKFMADGRV